MTRPGRFAPYFPNEGMRWGFSDIGLGLGLFASVIVVAALGFSLIGDADPQAIKLSIGVASYSALVFVLLRASRKHGLGSLAADFGLTFRSVDVLIGLVVGGTVKGASVLFTFAAIAVTRHTPAQGNVTVSSEIVWAVLNGVLVTCILAPAVEELFFRGLVLRAIRNVQLRGDRARHPRAQRHALISSILLSSLMFMLLHAWQTTDTTLLITIALSTLLLGVVNGVIVAATGRLAPAIIAHTVFNVSAVIPLLTSN